MTHGTGHKAVDELLVELCIQDEHLFLPQRCANFLQGLKDAGYVIVPREPTDTMKRAAFGPIMIGGRGGPISADFIRQEAALSTYRKIIEAAAHGEKQDGGKNG